MCQLFGHASKVGEVVFRKPTGKEIFAKNNPQKEIFTIAKGDVSARTCFKGWRLSSENPLGKEIFVKNNPIWPYCA